MGVNEEQRFPFQALPYEESYIRAHVFIYRDTHCLGLQTEPSERYILEI